MIATAVLAADLAGAFESGDTSSVRARTTVVLSGPPGSGTGTQTTPLGVDLVTAPFARIRLGSRRWVYALTYTPTFTVPDVGLGFQVQTFHFAGASIGWRDRSTTLTLRESLSYGEFNSAFPYQAPVAPGQTPVVQPAARPTTIHYASSNTSATVGLSAVRHIRLSLSGGYGLSGGADAQSQVYLPRQYGPYGGVSFNYSLSRQDSLGTSVNAADVSTTGQCPPPQVTQAPQDTQVCHVRSSSIIVEESLSRRLSPTARASLGAGIGVVNTRTSVDQLSVYPDVSGAFSEQFGQRGWSELLASVQLAPLVDPRTGFVSERLQISVVLTNVLTSLVTLHAGAGVLQSVPTDSPYAVSVITASVDAGFRLDRRVTLSIGQQGLWQTQAGYGTLVSVFSFVALTLNAPEIRL